MSAATHRQVRLVRRLSFFLALVYGLLSNLAAGVAFVVVGPLVWLSRTRRRAQLVAPVRSFEIGVAKYRRQPGFGGWLRWVRQTPFRWREIVQDRKERYLDDPY